VALTFDTVLAAIHSDDRRGVEAAVRSASTSQQAQTVELRLLPVDPESRWMALTVLGSYATLTEITAHKHLETEFIKQRQQLVHLGRVSLLGELSAALAHELNQPLTSILSNAEAAQHLLGDRDCVQDLVEVRHILDDIVADDRRAGDVIRRLRALLTRGETNAQRIEVQQLVRDVLALGRTDLTMHDTRLRTRIPEHLPAVRADRVELQQVFLNLIVNACEAMSGNPPENRLIDVMAAAVEDRSAVRVSVVDRGKGMSREQLERAFDPFFTTKSEGLGIGLSICRSIITAHGGHIWASSGTPRGAEFHFTLPAFEDANHEDEHTASTSLHS
jgi:two-component system, LuxR family, sensor kinase FixL